MSVKKDDDELDDLDGLDEAMQERRWHDDTQKSLSRIVTAITQKDNKEVVSAIDKQTKAIEGFVWAISKLEKQEQKEVKVEFNEKEIVFSLSEMGKAIINGLNELKEAVNKEEKQEKKEWEFNVIRKQGGYIDKVIAIQK